MRLATIEVSNIIAELMLSSEFESEWLTISKKLPKQLFGGCGLLSQFTGKLSQTCKLITSPVLACANHNENERSISSV